MNIKGLLNISSVPCIQVDNSYRDLYNRIYDSIVSEMELSQKDLRHMHRVYGAPNIKEAADYDAEKLRNQRQVVAHALAAIEAAKQISKTYFENGGDGITKWDMKKVFNSYYAMIDNFFDDSEAQSIKKELRDKFSEYESWYKSESARTKDNVKKLIAKFVSKENVDKILKKSIENIVTSNIVESNYSLGFTSKFDREWELHTTIKDDFIIVKLSWVNTGIEGRNDVEVWEADFKVRYGDLQDMSKIIQREDDAAASTIGEALTEWTNKSDDKIAMEV